MSGLLPAAVFGLEVPAGDVMVPAEAEFPAAFRITMAAIDPSAEPVHHADMPHDAPARATLKLIRVPIDEDESDEDEDDEDLQGIINGTSDSETNSSEDDANGGPSDPTKSKKARKEAAVKALREALADSVDEDEEMDDAASTKINKGKGVALDDNEDDSGDEDDLRFDEFVVCTLDTTKIYQQPLDITIGENEQVYFKVSGTHAMFLTGNYVMPVDDSPERMTEDDGDEYDLSPDEDGLYDDEDEESDELDDLEDPRITELESDEEAPKLVASKGTSKKRGAQDEEESLDDIMAKATHKAEATNGPARKQQKKQKNNAGEAVPAPASTADKKIDKKVQFAKNLEQGPTPSNGKKEDKTEAQKTEAKKDNKAQFGVKTIQGVKIDDRKTGSGPAAKKGSKVGMRYIGKLEDGKVFDSNKKGKPFTFTLGAGEVIKGWDIGVEGMTVGGERRITVPANLAYGSKSLPGIPKNSTLIFDLKVVEIK